MARYHVVAAIFVEVNVVVVFAIVVNGPAAETVEDSHLTTLPTWPVKVNGVLLVTPQTLVLAGLTVPPTEAATTVNTPGLLLVPPVQSTVVIKQRY